MTLRVIAGLELSQAEPKIPEDFLEAQAGKFQLHEWFDAARRHLRLRFVKLPNPWGNNNE